jgi:Family of unknown function (DUF695)
MSASEWMSVQREYEGFPLFLRIPLGLNYDILQQSLPVLVTVEHTFSFRRFDGAPEPRYNDTLEDFDVELSSLFDGDELGKVVLIETFGGKRNYYFYVASQGEPASPFEVFQSRHPGAILKLDVRSDPTWRFARSYRAEFFAEI